MCPFFLTPLFEFDNSFRIKDAGILWEVSILFWLEFFCCYSKKAVTRIECADITEGPDEFRIFSVLIGAFCVYMV